jgi:hypothetical protein
LYAARKLSSQRKSAITGFYDSNKKCHISDQLYTFPDRGSSVAGHLPRHSKVKGSKPSSTGIGIENGGNSLNTVLMQRENSHHKENEL